MGKLTDKLERAEKGAGQPLGFGGAAKRESIAPVLLLGAWSQQATPLRLRRSPRRR